MSPKSLIGKNPEICRSVTDVEKGLVPPAGIEPALLSEPDFESGASTNSAKGARVRLTGANGGTIVAVFVRSNAFFGLLLIGINHTVK